MKYARNLFNGPARWAVAVTFGLALLGSQVSLAHAAPPVVINPACGDTVGPGGKFILGGNVGACGTDPALTVEGPVKLDLGGFTVSCVDDTVDGIHVTGEKAKVTNGTVTGCSTGFDVRGTGKHKLENLTSTSNTGDEGFKIRSDKNKLKNNTASGNEQDGFDTRGTKNKLKNNTATNNGANGFDISGADNRLRKNTARDNRIDGFVIRESVDGNILRKNLAENNLDDGFDITSGSTDNKVVNNTATGNGEFDLEDDNANCDNNKWKRNTFVTSEVAGGPNPGCIETAAWARRGRLARVRVRRVNGGWQARLKLNAVPDRLRVTLNGKRNHQLFKISSKGTQVAWLAPDDGLRYGRNVLKVSAVYRGGIDRVRTVTFHVSRKFPLASAGPHQAVRLHKAVWLDARHSLPQPNSGHVTWRIVGAPSASQASLLQPGATRTSFTPDKVGDYRVELTVQDEHTGAIGRDIVTVTVTLAPMALPLVPVDTAATVEGEPGIAIGYHPARTGGRAPQGDGEAFYPLGSGNALQILVLDRRTLETVETFSGPPTQKTYTDALTFVSAHDDSTLVLITVWANPQWSEISQLPGLLAWAFTDPNGPAGLIGAQQVSQVTDQTYEIFVTGQMSFIGVPGFPAGKAWQVWGRPQYGANDLVTLDGFLTPDNNQNYVYLGTAPEGFDLGPDGQSVSLSIGGEIFDASLDDGEGGFAAVYLDAKTLQPSLYVEGTVPTQATYQTRNSDGSPNLSEMQRMTTDLGNVALNTKPPMFVAIRSIGSQPLAYMPPSWGQQFNPAYASALNALASAVAGVGGQAQWIYGMATAPQAQNSYSLIGGNVTSTFPDSPLPMPGSGQGLGTDLGTAASPTPSSTHLRGFLVRSRNQGYEVRGAANAAMSPVLAQLIADEPVPWPYAGSNSLRCIGIYLNLGSDPRLAYWNEPIDTNWTQTYFDLERIKVQDCGSPADYPDFAKVKTEILSEINWITRIVTYLQALSAPFSDDGLSSYTDLKTLTDDIKAAVTPPPSVSVGISGWTIFADIAGIIAEGFEDVPGLGLVAAVSYLAADVFSNQTNGPTTDYREKVQAAADEIGQELATQLEDAAANYEHIFDIIVADHGKLSTAGQYAGCYTANDNPACPPEWQFTQAQQESASQIFLINAQRKIWGGLMAAAYPYVLMTSSNPNAYNGTFEGPQNQISGIGCDFAQPFPVNTPVFMNYGIQQTNDYLFLVFSQSDFKGATSTATTFPPASLFTPSALSPPFEAINSFDPSMGGLGMDQYEFMVENWPQTLTQPPIMKNWQGC